MTPAQSLLLELRSAGLSLTVERRGALVCRPRSALTDALRAAIRELKPELITLLSGCEVCSRPLHRPDVVCPNPSRADERYVGAPGFAGVEPTVWDEALADTWIAITLERIGRWHNELAPDCDIDTAEWDRREAEVAAAYALGSRVGLRRALDAYEQHARAEFEAWAQRKAA